MLACVITHNMVIGDEGLNNMQGFEHVTTIQMCRELTFNSYMEFIEKLEIKTSSYHFKVIW
jgi:hypothetical protein